MAEFAELYSKCAEFGVPNPRDVDGMELWEVAALIGVEAVGTSGERDLIAERVEAARLGLPPPEPDRPTGPPPGVGTLVPIVRRQES